MKDKTNESRMMVEKALDFIKLNPRVAIVGLSPKTDRPSYGVAKFLIDKGFDVVPVNPGHDEIMGLQCKRSLAELDPGEVDWLDMFVNPSRLNDFLDEIVRLNPKLVWCQIGVVNETFNQELGKNGIPHISNVCPKQEWKKKKD